MALPSAEERSGPALREAQALTLLARIEADEAAAAASRAAYQHDGLPSLVPEGAIVAELRDGERLHAIRDGARLNRQDGGPLGCVGTLYLTSRRLVHIGQAIFSVPLESLSEVSVAGQRLLLAIADGEGVIVELDSPRLLRVLIATARNGLNR